MQIISDPIIISLFIISKKSEIIFLVFEIERILIVNSVKCEVNCLNKETQRFFSSKGINIR
jgi:hypothetical protein